MRRTSKFVISIKRCFPQRLGKAETSFLKEYRFFFGKAVINTPFFEGGVVSLVKNIFKVYILFSPEGSKKSTGLPLKGENQR